MKAAPAVLPAGSKLLSSTMTLLRKLPNRLRREWPRWQRTMLELVGSDRRSRPALHELDRKLEPWLPKRPGFFVEAGANDGFTQSNTYYYEKLRGWRGLLIEPVPWLAAQCRRNRSRSRVVQSALVGFDFPQATIALDYSNLTSTVAGAFGDEERRARHQAKGLATQWLKPLPTLEVPARTLQSILEEVQAPREFDLLSLDVEGYEPMALAGLDFSVYRPRFILTEVRNRELIEGLLSSHYRQVAVLSDMKSYQDVLYQVR